MNRRIRKRSTADHGYFRYLKPGALAQLRDFKINARTHHRSSASQIPSSPSRSPNAAVSDQQQEVTATVDGGSPCFTMRLYGPCCPQRKKLMAARSILYLNPNPSNPASDGPEPVIDAFSNDYLLAH